MQARQPSPRAVPAAQCGILLETSWQKTGGSRDAVSIPRVGSPGRRRRARGPGRERPLARGRARGRGTAAGRDHRIGVSLLARGNGPGKCEQAGDPAAREGALFEEIPCRFRGRSSPARASSSCSRGRGESCSRGADPTSPCSLPTGSFPGGAGSAARAGASCASAWRTGATCSPASCRCSRAGTGTRWGSRSVASSCWGPASPRRTRSARSTST